MAVVTSAITLVATFMAGTPTSALGGLLAAVGRLGGDAHAGGLHDSQAGAHQDAEQHTDSTQIFSILSFRTVVAALAFFGVAGEVALSAGYAPSTSLILAMIAGGFAM